MQNNIEYFFIKYLSLLENLRNKTCDCITNFDSLTSEQIDFEIEHENFHEMESLADLPKLLET